MRTFIYGDKSEVLSVSRTASQPSLHSSFVLPVMTKKKKKKKKPFTKSLKKKQLPAKSNLVKTTATSVILSLVGMQGDCTLNQADLGSNPISNTFDSGQVWSLANYGP